MITLERHHLPPSIQMVRAAEAPPPHPLDREQQLCEYRSKVNGIPVHTVDREIFSGRNFHLLNFRVINFRQSSNRRKLNTTNGTDFFLRELRVAYAERNPYTYVHGLHTCAKRKWRAFERSRALGGTMSTGKRPLERT